jgi:hypothetical protein
MIGEICIADLELVAETPVINLQGEIKDWYIAVLMILIVFKKILQ